jgi:hypothetical protein
MDAPCSKIGTTPSIQYESIAIKWIRSDDREAPWLSSVKTPEARKSNVNKGHQNREHTLSALVTENQGDLSRD